MADFKIVKGSIDLGKDGKFGAGREDSLEKALKARKDSSNILKKAEEKGYIRKVKSEKKVASKKSDSK